MKRSAVFATLLIGVAASVSAQSIEQSYAEQCSNGQQSETCTVLRAAMLEKLNEQSSGAGSAEPISQNEASEPQWGFFLDLMKEPHVYVLGKGMRDMAYASPIVTYSWKQPGEVILVTSEMPGGPKVDTATLHWDKRMGALIETTVDEGTETALLPQSDGSFVTESEQVRISYRKSLHGAEQVVEAKSAKGWDLLWRYDLVPFTPETLGLLRQIHENNIAVAKINASIPAKYHDPEYLRQAQEAERQRQARKKSKGGMFGALVGAAVGAYAGSAAGMDTSDTLGLMMRGAAAASPNNAIAQAAANGWAEETAKQDMMQASMENAAGAGFAQGPDGHGGQQGTNTVATPPPSSPSTSEPAAAKPLRFVLSISLLNKPGDTVNPRCYSSVITRPGPPGWGATGFLPSGSAERANAAIMELKANFIAACRAHPDQREITSEGNFSWFDNRSREDGELSSIGGNSPQDIFVSLN